MRNLTPKLAHLPNPLAQPTNPMRTLANLRAWVKSRGILDERGKPWTTPRLNQALLWWYAMEQATEWEDLRRKDIARLLQAGFKPLTLKEVQEYLNQVWEDVQSETAPAEQASAYREQIETSLKDHFGIKRD